MKADYKTIRTLLTVSRTILIILAISLFVWLFFKTLTLSGRFEVCWTPEKYSSFISEFYPESRMMEQVERDENGLAFRRIIIEPVYFKVKVPRVFEEARVKVLFQNPGDEFFQLGARLAEGPPERDPWLFQFRPLDSSNDNFNPSLRSGQAPSGWQEAEVLFEKPIIIKGWTEFMLSAPNLQKGRNEIKIARIEITFKREPVTWQDFWPWLTGYIIKTLKH